MKIRTTHHTYEVDLLETPTAKELLERLPLKGKAILWGKEIYFSIPLESVIEPGARDIMEEGEIAYYPPMNAFCIFFGPTPASTDRRPRAADDVNVLGKIKGDFSKLNEVASGEVIELIG